MSVDDQIASGANPVTGKRRPISWTTRQWVKERDKFRCVDCGTHENLTVDHIVPVSKGGTNDVSNLTTRCQSCNSHKGAKTMSTPRETASDRSDRLSSVVRKEFDPRSLVGSFFLTDSSRTWQGCVVAEVAPQVFLVETFSWVMGESYEQKLVTLADMMTWSFYDSAEWMRNSYEHGVGARWEHERDEGAD